MGTPTFRTVLPPRRAPFALAYSDPILSLGSCFAVQIGERLQMHKFSIENNPFGILYNPISMIHSLERLRSGRPYRSEDLFVRDGLWHSFDHHGAFSHASPDATLEAVNEALQRGSRQLEKCRRLILTFGTAFVFEHIDQRRTVANCHKMPAAQFHRYRLHVEEIVDKWTPFLQDLKAELPELRVICSVSPVRHLRDGLVENQRSKATLALALDELCRRLDFVHYFPAYELVLDDLRDYRFYDRDLSHPSAVAIDYIWDHFLDTYLDEPTRQVLHEVQKIIASSTHRPLHPGTTAHRQFAEQQLARIAELQKSYPFLNFSRETAHFRSQLAHG